MDRHMVELLDRITEHSRGHGSDAAGFTLVEVLLSMTMLAIGVLVLGGLLTRSARSADATALVVSDRG